MVEEERLRIKSVSGKDRITYSLPRSKIAESVNLEDLVREWVRDEIAQWEKKGRQEG